MNKEVTRILRRLEKECSLTYVEAALQLRPFGILSKWKNGTRKIPPEAVALLRIINVHPNLFLRVADNDFKDANKILVEEVLIKPELDEQERVLKRNW